MEKDPSKNNLKIDSPPVNLNMEEDVGVETQDFPEGVRETLTEKAQKIIAATENIMQSGPWFLRFFKPKSEEEIERRRQAINKELRGRYSNEDDLRAMEERGLSLGGIRTTEEESRKAVKFLTERELDRRGQLKPLLRGYAVLNRGGRQIHITEDQYATKYGGITDLEGAVKYLLEIE